MKRILLVAALLATPMASATADEWVNPPLNLDRNLGLCETHVYRIQLAAGETLRGFIEDDGIEVQVRVIRASDELEIIKRDASTDRTRERWLALAAQDGEYLLHVQPSPRATKDGHYHLRIDPIRTTTTEDLLEATADLLLAGIGVHGVQVDRPPLEDALYFCRAAGSTECEAEMLTVLAYALWFAGQDVPAARDLLLQALAIHRKSDDRLAEGVALNDLGILSRHIGDLLEARDYMEAALVVSEPSFRDMQPNLLNSLAPVYWQLGELQKAIDTEQQALERWTSIRWREGEAYALTNLGQFALQLGDPGEAFRLHAAALEKFRAGNHRTGMAENTMRLGIVTEAMGDRDRALRYFCDSLSISESENDPVSQSRVLVRIGKTLTALGRQDEALQAFERALGIIRAAKLDETAAAQGFAGVYEAAGEFDLALAWYGRAVDLTAESGDALPRAEALVAVARVESRRGKLSEALIALDEATAVIETVRLRLTNPEVRASYLAARQSHYDLMVDVLMRLSAKSGRRDDLVAQALEVSERARARSLLDALTFARVRDRHADPNLAARVDEVRHRLNGKAAALARMSPAQRKGAAGTALRGEIDVLLGEYRELRAATSGLEHGRSAEILTLAEIQELLDSGTTLLEYALGESRSYLWVVTRGSVRNFTLPPRREIERLARRVIELVPQTYKREVSAQAQMAARRLSDAILGSAAATLQRQRLLVVGDGALQLVSFAALPDPVAPSQPLLVNHEIVMLPSASLLAALRADPPRREPALTIALFADPVLSADDERVAGRAGATRLPPDLVRSVHAFDDAGFGRLPHTRAEADRITALVPSEQQFRALDFAASRENATGGDLARYRIVHFATHGLINTQQPELSGLVLSLYDASGSPRDGFLRLSDIYALDLNADLVVLSACRTALGKEIWREGMVGLTRGFMYAGASRVVASLWDVRDRSTAELMHRFYRRMLVDGMPAAAALREAQLSLWREPHWREPFYWAPFVLQGEWR